MGGAMSRLQTTRRVLVPILILAVPALLWWSGALSDFDLDAVRALVEQAGAWGPVLFLLMFALLQPFGISSHVFILTAAVIWPPQIALPLSWSGTMLSAIVAFFTSRVLARDVIQKRIPKRFRRWDDALAERGFRTVLMLRLLFFTTFLVQFMFGLTKVRWRDYLLGTALGNLPMIVLEIIFADKVLAWIG